MERTPPSSSHSFFSHIGPLAWAGALALLGLSLFSAESNGLRNALKRDKTDFNSEHTNISSVQNTVQNTVQNETREHEIQIRIDSEHPIGPINPLIYGMAMPTPAHYQELRVSVARWGGNPNSRYNWEKGNCWNAARDWKFANGNYGVSDPAKALPSGTADQFIQEAHNSHAACLITIPTLGWVARDNDNSHASINVPDKGGNPVSPGSEAIPGYDPTSNRALVSVRSLPRKGRPFADPPDLKDDVVYQDEWVAHLTHRFGPAGKGGVNYYAMDNEPDLWDYTHTDMHPTTTDYVELRDRFLNYADAIKTVDPSAKITGPVSWGWNGYFYSPRDRGDDRYASRPDRRTHRNMPFLPWFLSEVASHDRQVGHRTLDVLDVHYYPQGKGIHEGYSDSSTNALRLRSTRALWDLEYRDESWVDAKVALFPRLHQWIQKYYPGTRLALTEWNWGAENTLNGGLAVAEVLGILGREQVDMACYWTAPPAGSPAFYAYKLYRNADEAGHGFGNVALPTVSLAPDRVSCFAAKDSDTITVVLINKSDVTESVKLATTIKPSSNKTTQHSGEKVQIFRFDNSHPDKIVRLPDRSSDNSVSSIDLPATSLTLLRYTKGS